MLNWRGKGIGSKDVSGEQTNLIQSSLHIADQNVWHFCLVPYIKLPYMEGQSEPILRNASMVH